MTETKLQKLEDVILPILETNASSRNDNFELVLRVYEKVLDYGDYLDTMSFRELVTNHNSLDLPSFESITRVRRKLQQMYPELKPNKEMQIIRTNATADYIEYAFDI